MTLPVQPLDDVGKMILGGVMDRLVPPIDDLPGAGKMGLASEVDSLARRHAPYQRSLSIFIEKLATKWSERLPDSDKDALLRDLENADGATFTAVLELVYLAYYGDARVHGRVGWRGGPLQPEGFPLPPFNAEILQAVRERRPFWRPTQT
jgi:hypothetical protein